METGERYWWKMICSASAIIYMLSYSSEIKDFRCVWFDETANIYDKKRENIRT
jgi:hypothetical protein